MAIDCAKCEATGLCLRCHGCGRKGFFIKLPLPTAPKCDHCRGSGRCAECGGVGHVEELVWHPVIDVVSESTRPSCISVAAISGAGWRYIRVPQHVLTKTQAEQYDWVGWCVQDHFRESKGDCFLFGRITGYAYRPTQADYIRFTVNGNMIDPLG